MGAHTGSGFGFWAVQMSIALRFWSSEWWCLFRVEGRTRKSNRKIARWNGRGTERLRRRVKWKTGQTLEINKTDFLFFFCFLFEWSSTAMQPYKWFTYRTTAIFFTIGVKRIQRFVKDQNECESGGLSFSLLPSLSVSLSPYLYLYFTFFCLFLSVSVSLPSRSSLFSVLSSAFSHIVSLFLPFSCSFDFFSIMLPLFHS